MIQRYRRTECVTCEAKLQKEAAAVLNDACKDDVVCALADFVVDIFNEDLLCPICEEIENVVCRSATIVPSTSWLGGWTTEDLKQLQLEDSDILSKVITWKKNLTSKPDKEMLQQSSAGVRVMCCQWDSLGLKDGKLYRAYSPNCDSSRVLLQLVAPLVF